jgi:murein DD-endopeptidase MepM/ murein hydrolase activator NlpD
MTIPLPDPTRPRPDFKYLVAAGLVGFILGAFVVASLGSVNFGGPRGIATKGAEGPALDDAGSAIVEAPAPTSGRTLIPSLPSADERSLAARDLTIPVQGVSAGQLVRSFHDSRGGRQHEAIDILAPRNTPVLAVEDGTIARLFVSKAGGNTIYQFDPSSEFAYYYAHLERYAEGLKEGDPVRKGQIIGYVGTSGNAPKETPHLHFAVFKLTADKHWWEGTPLDPFDVLR